MPLTAGATAAQDGPDTATHRGSYVDQSSPRADVRWNVEQLDRILTEQGDGDVLVGDMVFRRAVLQRHRDALAGATPTSSDGARASAGAGATQWPGGIIYYTFDAGVSAPHRAHFLDAGAEWGAFSNVSFVARGTQAHYVTVKDVAGLTGGNSSIGMAGGQQFLNIGSGSWNRATLLHEIGHALGFVHEHQRSDRDTYVTILTANIAPGKEADFVVLPSSNFGAYDFLSVMHYARSTLSVDPATKDTIVPTTPYEFAEQRR